jgi:hypothetical protein
MASDNSRLTPHRRKHWSVEPPQLDVPVGDVLSPEETRVEAKRLLWRDSAIILIGIVLALLVAQFVPGPAPGLVADQTASASGPGAGETGAPGDSTAPGATVGPVVDPSLGIDATQPPIAPITLPPTGTFEPDATADPTPRPTKKPTSTIAPPTPAPTPEPPTPAPPTEVPTPPATDPPGTDPPATEPPTPEPPTGEPTEPA